MPTRNRSRRRTNVARQMDPTVTTPPADVLITYVDMPDQNTLVVHFSAPVIYDGSLPAATFEAVEGGSDTNQSVGVQSFDETTMSLGFSYDITQGGEFFWPEHDPCVRTRFGGYVAAAAFYFLPPPPQQDDGS